MKGIQTLMFSALLAVPLAASAQFAVFDSASYQQLMQQVSSWRQQLQSMQLQLSQLQKTNAALTGTRGMQSLLRSSPQSLNYLPNNAQVLTAVSSGGGGTQYGSLGSAVTAQTVQNALMSATMLNGLSPQLAKLVTHDRSINATSQTISRAAYTEASARFASLTALITEIGAATDAKAIADLQARILGEQILLANDGAKLQTVAQIADADRAANEQSKREAIFVQHGNFATRFQPTPPAP